MRLGEFLRFLDLSAAMEPAASLPPLAGEILTELWVNAGTASLA